MNKKHLSLLLAGAGALTAAAEQPNVIIILADDLGYGDLECYGATKVKTPSVNRLAKEGQRFTQAYAAAATSTPSRYGLLTGEYAWRRKGTGVSNGDAAMIITPERYTMADMMGHAGYATAAIGKWHLGLGDKSGGQNWNEPLACSLGDIGFDYSYIMAATADRVPCVFIENGSVANYDPEAPITVSYKAPIPGEPTGHGNPELLDKMMFNHGHDQGIVNGISRIGYMKGGGKALWKDENIADSIVAHGVRFIEKHANEPFFMYFCTNDVHVPRWPHDRFRGKNEMGLRGDAIAQFDWSVGRILDTLDSLGIADNTLVILSSDNGPIVDDGYNDGAVEKLGDHRPAGPLSGTKYSIYEGGSRVPFIVRWPKGVEAGKENNTIVSQIDLFASLGKLIGARIPAAAAPDSFDRLGTFLGTDHTHRPWVVQQAHDNSLALRTPDMKYVEPTETDPVISWNPSVTTGYSPEPKLFDMAKDPTETTNLAIKKAETANNYARILDLVKASDYRKLKTLGMKP
ncbi:MAG: arylsulfatase [Muribaculaceae bacterium]|nr:arylsulfatase [Muribaculaceae bacterium]